jgi:hypothetical protein
VTPEQETHLSHILDRAERELRVKYADGQKEHGGNIWAKGGLMQQMRAEALDQMVYTDVIEQQLRGIADSMRQGLTECRLDIVWKAWDRLDQLLNGACD